jgi:hypothetical protein
VCTRVGLSYPAQVKFNSREYMKASQLNFTPMLSLAPSYASEYFKVEKPAEFAESSNKFDITSVDNSDQFSKTSQRKLKNYIDWFVEQSKIKRVTNLKTKKDKFYKLNLITLTLPFEQFHSDQEIKKTLLNQFLIEAKKRWLMYNYIWRAEKQKNGNIHFHIVSDVFVPWQECRECWNRICDKLDLVKLYTARMKERFELGFNITQEEIKKYSMHVLKERYKSGKKTGWTNPNSVDVHSLYNINNVGSYLTKYLTKKVESDLEQFNYTPGTPPEIVEILEKQKEEYLSKKQVQGRNWFVSDNIRRYCKNLTIEIKEEIVPVCLEAFTEIKDLIINNQFITVIKKGAQYFSRKSQLIKKLYDKHIEEMRIKLHHGRNYDCLWKIKNMKINFSVAQKVKLKPIQLNLFNT